MKMSLRLRYVVWLLVLMVLLFFSQLVAFTLFEIHEYRRHGGDAAQIREDVEEVLLLLGIDAVVLPFVLLAAWAISGRMLAPLHAVAATSRRISLGNLSERVTSPGADDEIGSLVQTINGAFDKYQDVLLRLERFTSDASHQLRTPLAALRNTGEVCLQKDRPPEEYRDTLGAMLEEAARLSTIVEKLLLLARLERSQVTGAFQRVDVSALLRDVVQAFAPFAQDRRIALVVQAEDGLAVAGDSDLLNQVFANLMDNAVRYTPRDGTVRVRLQREGGGIRLAIADSGPGIPAPFRGRIFDRFNRGPGATGDGSGLGLAIVADIVRIHGGSVEAVASDMGGAEFRVDLPAAPPS